MSCQHQVKACAMALFLCLHVLQFVLGQGCCVLEGLSAISSRFVELLILQCMRANRWVEKEMGSSVDSLWH